MSLERLNNTLGGFFRSQLERRSLWLKLLLVFLGFLVVLNVAGIRPHEAVTPSHGGAATHGESPEGAAPHADVVPPPHLDEALQAAGVAMNYYPQGAHTYNLTRWVSKNAAGRAVLDGFHYLHSSEAVPGFWAVFGVLIAVLLVRVAKGAAHTFLGKGEDFYDR